MRQFLVGVGLNENPSLAEVARWRYGNFWLGLGLTTTPPWQRLGGGGAAVGLMQGEMGSWADADAVGQGTEGSVEAANGQHEADFPRGVPALAASREGSCRPQAPGENPSFLHLVVLMKVALLRNNNLL